MNDLEKLKEISSRTSVLYVEDDTDLRESFAKFLRKIFPRVIVCNDGKSGLEAYKEKPSIDIVISDIMMPHINGLEMVSAIKKINPDQEVIFTTAFNDTEYLLQAIDLGVESYILKPVNFLKLSSSLHKVVQRIQNEKDLKKYKTDLEELVEKRTHEKHLLELEIIENYRNTLISLVNLIEERDSYTGGHSQRVAIYSKLIAKKMGYSDETCQLMYNAGILHDIGKITTPDAVLLKPGKLNDAEYTLIKEHVNSGYALLNKIPMYNEIAKIVRSHHERYDGQGYPDGLINDDIHELSRIMIVADAFDAMTTSRIYKARKSIDEALKDLQMNKEKQFDPEVVDAACKVLKDIYVEENISQLPKNEIEQERFSFFFKDQLTGLYNQDYLDIVLLQNKDSQKYKYINILKLDGMKSFNDLYGWEKGDEIIHTFSKYLHQKYHNDHIYRIHGYYFILLSEEGITFEANSFELNVDILQISSDIINLKETQIQSSSELYKI